MSLRRRLPLSLLVGVAAVVFTIGFQVTARADAFTHYSELSTPRQHALLDWLSEYEVSEGDQPYTDSYPTNAAESIKSAFDELGKANPTDVTLADEEAAFLTTAGEVSGPAALLDPPALLAIGAGVVTGTAVVAGYHAIGLAVTQIVAGLDFSGFPPGLPAEVGLTLLSTHAAPGSRAHEEGFAFEPCYGPSGPTYPLLGELLTPCDIPGEPGELVKYPPASQTEVTYQLVPEIETAPGFSIPVGSDKTNLCEEDPLYIAPPYPGVVRVSVEEEPTFFCAHLSKTVSPERSAEELPESALELKPHPMTAVSGAPSAESGPAEAGPGFNVTRGAEALETFITASPKFRESLEDEVWPEGAEAEVTPCRAEGLWGSRCKEVLEERGFESVTETEAPWEEMELSAGGEGVLYTLPPEHTTVPTTTPVEIDRNPEYTEIPQPTPLEPLTVYEEKLHELGFDHVETFVESPTEYESQSEERKRRRRVVVVIPEPGKTTEPAPDGEPGGTPDTGPGAAPEIHTDVKVEANPDTQGSTESETDTEEATETEPKTTGGGGTGARKLARLAIGGVTEPEIKSPHVAVLCEKFPFGVPCWVVEEIEAWSGTGSAPTLGIDSFTIHGSTIPGGSVSLSHLEPIMDKVRPFMIIFGTVGLVLVFYSFATGGSGGKGGDDTPDGGSEDY